MSTNSPSKLKKYFLPGSFGTCARGAGEEENAGGEGLGGEGKRRSEWKEIRVEEEAEAREVEGKGGGCGIGE